MRKLLTPFALVLALCLAACAAVPAQPAAGPGPRLVVLISIDGFRPDYLDRGITPHLSALAARGARGALRPAFPSKTFPNHYTLVTGLRPDRHGVVDNTMIDPQLPGRTFRLGDAAEVTDAAWWDEAIPIWVSAERAGLPTATMFWPGSEAAIGGARPTHWMRFDQSMRAEARVDQVLGWLDGPQPPAFVTLYFDEVDSYGHWNGPGSPEVDAAIARTAAAVGRLAAGLAARGLLTATALVVVADHGMAATSRTRVIPLEGLVEAADGRALVPGPSLAFQPDPARRAQAEAALLRDHEHMDCWRKADLPARFGYGRHRRVPDLFCLADIGWEILPEATAARRPMAGGAHGYDPADPAMAALFLAAGPHFRAGVALPAFDNVNVYPLLARLLDVTPEPNEGDLEALRAALRP